MDEDADIKEFHDLVRDCIIGLLYYIFLFLVSYFIVCKFKRRADHDEIYAGDAEDALVYRVSLGLCTVTLTVSGGAVLLLPLSIIANEALLIFPKSFYLQWVNSSLIYGLWNSIFLSSNVSLFILMPFAYLFTESEGLPGSKRGIMSRVYETIAVLILLAIVIYGLSLVISALMDDKANRKALFNDIWNFYLLYLYSCISLLGVLMLLVCTPVGFALLFTVMGDLIFKPKFLQDVDGELEVARMEEASLIRQMAASIKFDYQEARTESNGHAHKAVLTDLNKRLSLVQKTCQELERRQKASPWRRNLAYPVVMLLLLLLTSGSVLLVAQNMVELLVGVKALPVGTKEMVLGISSLSVLGPVGAAIEITIILYLMVTSVVGFYSLPFFMRLRPKVNDTSMTSIIGNCVVILVLSSALPVLSRTLGITNFDLLGNFGRLEWLGNFYIVLLYNLLFAVATVLCLVTKFTSTVLVALIGKVVLSVQHAFNAIRQLISKTAMSVRNAFHRFHRLEHADPAVSNSAAQLAGHAKNE